MRMMRNARGLLLVTVFFGYAPFASASALLAVDSLDVVLGQEFSVNVRIDDATDLFAWQFDLSFDPAILSAVSVSEGTFLLGGGITAFVPGAIDNDTGEIAFTADSLIGVVPGVTGSGVLASVLFRAQDRGTSVVTLSNVLLLDSTLSDIETVTRSGVASVPEPSTWSLLVGASASMLVRRRRAVRR